jgi:two-component system NtrC family response regulator
MIVVPPLRERRDEIIPLAEQFLHEFARRNNVPLLSRFKIISAEAMTLLINYQWPGNVRELRHMMERAFCLAEGRIITRDHITLPRAPQAFPDGEDGFLTIRQLEKDHIIRVLEYCEGNRRRASDILGIAVKTLYNRMTAYGLHERLTRKFMAL